MLGIHVLVIGGGVTGLAAAAELAAIGLSVAVAERHPRFGQETTTHNSGVIHAGIYYPAGSLKAQLCVKAPSVSTHSAKQNDVQHDRCGKFIVAARRARTSRTRGAREKRHRQRGPGARDGGPLVPPQPRAPGLGQGRVVVSGNGSRRGRSAREGPRPSVGVPRRHAAARARVIEGTPREDGFEVRLEHETSRPDVVNAAGLYADDVSRALGGEASRSTRAVVRDASSARRGGTGRTGSSTRFRTRPDTVSACT